MTPTRMTPARSTPAQVSDRGAAAVEMALVLTLLFSVLALVAPLAFLFQARVNLGQAAGEIIRFTTSRADVTRTAGSVTVSPGYLPSRTAVEQELLRFSAGGPITLTDLPAHLLDLTCPSGWRREVTVSTTVDLGPAGAAFARLTGSQTTMTLASYASSCEE